jgi:hypothetical protein
MVMRSKQNESEKKKLSLFLLPLPSLRDGVLLHFKTKGSQNSVEEITLLHRASNHNDFVKGRVGNGDGKIFKFIGRECRARGVVSFLERIIFQLDLDRLSSLSLECDGAFADLQQRQSGRGQEEEEGVHLW